MTTSQWGVDIPTRSHEGTGSQLFIVRAEMIEGALEVALAQAQCEAARRHRRDAVIDPDPTRITVVHLGHRQLPGGTAGM